MLTVVKCFWRIVLIQVFSVTNTVIQTIKLLYFNCFLKHREQNYSYPSQTRKTLITH